MVKDDVSTIMNNAIIANRNSNYKNEKELINNLIIAINDNKDLFEKANQIDLKNNNGIKLDFNIINKILDRYKDVNPLINSKDDISLLDDELLHSKVYTKLGILLVIFDGNTYTMLELIIIGLLTHNTMIFKYDGYQSGTNGLLISLVEAILEKEKMNKYMYQETTNINIDELFKNYKTVNKVVLIGDNDFTSKYLKECPIDTIVSGYKNYDLYIDYLVDEELARKIIKQGLNINYYINNNINVDLDNAIYVEDVEEAITYINYNGSNYSSGIMTNDNNSAAMFVNMINSKNVFVNASPTLEQSLDLEEKDLLKEKTIVMPNIYKFDGKKVNINIE